MKVAKANAPAITKKAVGKKITKKVVPTKGKK